MVEKITFWHGLINITHTEVLLFSSWVLLIICAIPQIVLNYKLKSAKGLSDLMLFCSLNSMIFGLFFIYCSSMPLLYKVMSPLAAVIFFIVVAQRIFYSEGKNDRFPLFLLLNALFFIGLIPYAYYYPCTVGWYAGWVGFFLQCVYQFPQLIKIYHNKSTHGFSLAFVSLNALAGVLEFIVAIEKNLPIVVIISDMRTIVLYICFLILFVYYGDRSV